MCLWISSPEYGVISSKSAEFISGSFLKKENTQKIFGYVRLKIFYLLPKDFYVKIFKRNYKNLLEDLKEKNVLTIEEM